MSALPPKRTSLDVAIMSAKCEKRTSPQSGCWNSAAKCPLCVKNRLNRFMRSGNSFAALTAKEKAEFLALLSAKRRSVLQVTLCHQRSALKCLQVSEAVMSYLKYGPVRQTDLNRFSVSAIAAMVASPTIVSRPADRTSVPNGYERVDIKILEWIRRSQQAESAAAATCRRAS